MPSVTTNLFDVQDSDREAVDSADDQPRAEPDHDAAKTAIWGWAFAYPAMTIPLRTLIIETAVPIERSKRE